MRSQCFPTAVVVVVFIEATNLTAVTTGTFSRVSTTTPTTTSQASGPARVGAIHAAEALKGEAPQSGGGLMTVGLHLPAVDALEVTESTSTFC